MNYDFVIVGGGPAGSTLARLLADKYKVLLLEQRNLDAPWQNGQWRKACGGLLSPAAQYELAEMGLSVPAEVLESPQPLAVQAVDLDEGTTRVYQRFYTNINREAFDRWLWGLVPTQVDKKSNAIFLSYHPNTQRVTYKQNGLSFSVETRYLVGADGATSKVRQSVNAPITSWDRYISIQTWHKTACDVPYYGAFFAKDVTDFYGWSIPKKEGQIFGVAIPVERNNPLEKYKTFLRKIEEKGIEVGKQIRREGAIIIRPTHRATVCAGQGNIFLIGEAGGFISPSSAEGFSYAFRTAKALVRSFEDTENPDAQFYSHICWKLHLNLWMRRFRSPILYTPLLRRPIMTLGVGAIH